MPHCASSHLLRGRRKGSGVLRVKPLERERHDEQIGRRVVPVFDEAIDGLGGMPSATKVDLRFGNDLCGSFAAQLSFACIADVATDDTAIPMPPGTSDSPALIGRPPLAITPAISFSLCASGGKSV